MTRLHRMLQVFCWAFAVVYITASSLQITQVDLWWQLSEGLHILQTWTLPTAPIAAFGLTASPYFDEYAGYEIVLALIYKLGGFTAIWLAFVAVYAAIIFLPSATTGGRYPAFDFLTTTALFFAGLLMKERMEQRPDLVAGLLLVLLIITIRRARLENITARTLGALFVIFLAWTNTHSSFVFGFLVLGLWIVGGVAQNWRTTPARDLLLRGALPAIGAPLLAVMINPYGLRRLTFPFLQFSDPGSAALSPEMWPITDYTSIAGLLITTSVVLLAWGISTTRGIPLWLILFSVVGAFLAYKSFRFVNLLAISLLFVYAERREAESAKNGILTLLKIAGLGTACVFLLFAGVFNLLGNIAELRSEERFATHTPRFAPQMSATRVSDSGARISVLCAYNVGSYVSFADNSQFRPLLDSGLSHFSSETKRYFFFCWNNPAALELALRNLHVDYVIVNRDTFSWIPTLNRLPGWSFVSCDQNGMLWKRTDGKLPLDGNQRLHIGSTVQTLQQRGEMIGAFAFSTLVNKPEESLKILSQYGGAEWPDTVFNAICAWADNIPPDQIEALLATDHSPQCQLVDAILSARLGHDEFAKFLASNPSGSRPYFWKELEARDWLRHGDPQKARAIFDSISPIPISSESYYELRHELYGEIGLGAYGRWQTWDEGTPAFIDGISDRLNVRLALP